MTQEALTQSQPPASDMKAPLSLPKMQGFSKKLLQHQKGTLAAYQCRGCQKEWLEGPNAKHSSA